MKKILNNNYIILIPIFLLNIISLLYLFNTKYFIKQSIYILISYAILIIVSNINKDKLIKLSKIIYLISIILLGLVLIIGKEINGSKAWIHFFNFSFQLSELTKLALIIYSIYLIETKEKTYKFILIFLLPTILTFLEPDTGSVIIYFIIFISIINRTKIKKKNLIILTISLISFIGLNIYLYLSNSNILLKIYGPKIFYRIDRLISFKKMNNIQNINSLISIGAHKLLYIPENHNDFIFAAIISKYNIIIFLLILSSYNLIFIYIIKNISNIYNKVILNIFIFQIFYNILMNLSLLPIIGIPLPFMSYGGSYTLITYLMIGILININNKKVHLDNKEPLVQQA